MATNRNNHPTRSKSKKTSRCRPRVKPPQKRTTQCPRVAGLSCFRVTNVISYFCLLKSDIRRNASAMKKRAVQSLIQFVRRPLGSCKYHCESIDALLLVSAFCSVALLSIARDHQLLNCAPESAAALQKPESSTTSAASVIPVVLTYRNNRRRKTCKSNEGGAVACYARYSSNQQDEKSIQDQFRSCQAYAATKSMKIDDTRLYPDEAISGTIRHREGLDRMLADATAGEIRVIYFYNLSRLARESVITKTLMRQLVDLHRVRVICVVEGIDTDVNGWNTIASIFSLVHEEFLNILRENVRKGQIGTVENGFSVGDWRFGYTSIPSPSGETIRRAGIEVARRIYQIKEEEAKWVRQVFHWFAIDLRSIQWIVRELNRLQVPKDHRATSTIWAHPLVISMLRSPKYVGIWPWGELENIRHPETGHVVQVARDESKCDKWIRQREDLRIVDNDLFVEAQERLDENARRHESFRDPNGCLRGSDGGNRVQLLTGLMNCPGCGECFYVTGANGDYLQCRGARDGICDCKTMLPRRLASRLILTEIGQLIRNNSEWLNSVYQLVVKSWQELRRRNPTSVKELEERQQSLNTKVQRLLDQIENDSKPDPDIGLRLRERQRELALVNRDVEHLKAQERNMPEPPTCESVAAELVELHDVLQGNVVAANQALKILLGGSIQLELIEEESRKRKFWRGCFSVQVLDISKMAVNFESQQDHDSLNPEIVIDFREIPLEETQVKRAWELLKQGYTFTEIAKELGVKKARVTAIMKVVARRYGDGCSAKELKAKFSDLRPPSEPYRQYVESAIKLYHEGLLQNEIADQLGTHKKAVSFAIAMWHTDRGLPVPDGRTRRKSLEVKGRPRSNPPQDVQDFSDELPIGDEAA